MTGHDEHWNYSEESGRGPSAWPKHFPAGKAQSPINILVDYRDLHRSACNHCAPEQCGRLAGRLELKLALEDRQQQPHRHHDEPARRGHLDSVGNELDLDEQQYESDSQQYYKSQPDGNRSPSSVSDKSAASSNDGAGGPRAKLASECLTLWKSSRLVSPIQVRKAQLHEQDPAQSNKSSSSSLSSFAAVPGGKQLKQSTRYCVTNKKIFLGYPRFLNSIGLSNTGHGWQVDMPRELAGHTLVCGPPLGEREFRLAQFHCHWGADCLHGSEHQINGQSYAAELHFVHWNCSEFSSLEEAARHRHGLAVLAVLVQALEGEQNRNKHLDKLMRGIRAVRDEPHATRELANCRLDLKKLFPTNRWDYATYEGSLTTPPLSEVVEWVVFLQPIQCSASQVAEFRRLQCPSGALVSNCRPVQAHNQRTVTIWTHAHSH